MTRYKSKDHKRTIKVSLFNFKQQKICTRKLSTKSRN